MTWLAILVALFAAALFALGSVLQARAAQDVPDDEALGVGLITRLVRRPIWLIGSTSEILGYGAQAIALALGSLVLVQPLLATSLLFALPLGAWWAGRRLKRSDGVWAIILTVGLGLFLVAGNPTEGVDRTTLAHWLIAAAVLGPPVVICVVIAVRTRGAVRAVSLACAVGILYGVMSALTKSVMSVLDDGFVDIVMSWEVWALIAVSAAGTYLQQSSYQAGSLSQALPAAAVLEPLVAVALGMTLLNEKLQADGLEWALIALSAVAMIAATASLARSQAESEESQEAEPVPVAAPA